jgi:hypothetical protein
VNGADLTITFTTTDATPAAVQALARAIAFANTSGNPSTAAREATFTATDGDGGSSGGVTQTINVILVNSNPTLVLPGAALDYDENDPATAIDSTATVEDSDSADFNGGSLNISFAANGTANDQLSVLTAGGITVAGSTVSFSGNAIGAIDATDNGVNGADLTITFTTTDATPAAVQALVRAIGYANSSDNPSAFSRTVAFTVTDGDSGSSGAVNQTVNVNPVNDAPTTILPSGSASYMEGNPPVVIEPAFILFDPDSADFDGGTLTADITMNNFDDDRLAIRNQGNGAGQVGVAGNVISFGGTPVGTFAGGAKAIAALVVTFNASADSTAVQGVARNVTFENVATNPSTAPRVVEFVVTDGDGGTSMAASKVVNVGALPLPLSVWPLAAVLLVIGLMLVAGRRRLAASRSR